MNDLAPQIAGEIEELTIAIVRESEDKDLRRRSRGWTSTVIPIVYRSATLADPLAALIDTWVLCAQLRQALESGAANDFFGEYQPQAVQIAHMIEDQVAEIGRLAFTEEQLKIAERNLEAWVEKYPIGDPTWVRRSTVSFLASVIGKKEADAFSAVEDLSDSIDALRYEMNLYAELMPKQARWLTNHIIEHHGFDRTAADVTRVATSLEGLNETVDELPEVVRTELARVLA